MNGEMRELVETTAELTARRLLDKFVERLPCDAHMKKIEETEKRIASTEHVMASHVNGMVSTDDNIKELRAKIDKLWWKIILGVVIPLAIYFFINSHVI